MLEFVKSRRSPQDVASAATAPRRFCCDDSTRRAATGALAWVVVVSGAVRGRARLRVPGLRKQPALALHLQDRLGGDDRVRAVRPSVLTGNVLLLFDASRLDLHEILERIARETVTFRPPRKGTTSPRTRVEPPGTLNGKPWHTRVSVEALQSLN